MAFEDGEKVGSRTLESLRAKLTQLGIDYGNSITVPGTPGGFEVQAVDDEFEATVFASYWHGHFSDPDDAVTTFLRLLTSEARVEATFRRSQFALARLQFLQGGRWHTYQTIGVLTLPFGSKHVEISSNSYDIGSEPKE
jgi:hypothetical protein